MYIQVGTKCTRSFRDAFNKRHKSRPRQHKDDDNDDDNDVDEYDD